MLRFAIRFCLWQMAVAILEEREPGVVAGGSAFYALCQIRRNRCELKRHRELIPQPVRSMGLHGVPGILLPTRALRQAAAECRSGMGSGCAE